MLIELNAASVLHLVCLGQGLSSAAYLALTRPRTAANRWLALLLAALLALVFDYFLSAAGIYARHRWLYFSPLFFSWGFGPLLWRYVRALLGDATRPRGWAWHLVPLVGQVAFYLVLVGQDFDTKTAFWFAVHKPWTRFVEYYGALASLALYAAACRRQVARTPDAPRWLGRWLAGLLIFLGAAAVDALLNPAYLPPGWPRFYLSVLGLPLLIYVLAGLGWREAQRRAHAAVVAQVAAEAARRAAAAAALTTAGPTPAVTVLPPATHPEAAHLAALRRAAADAEARAAEAVAALEKLTAPKAPPAARPPADPALVARLVATFEQDHRYRDPDLTLDTLAAHLRLPPNAVSHLLNAGLGQSFADAVNGYRLAEVQRRLLTPDADRYTLLALALDAGFNSKSTFNRIFKEKTGLAPREWRRQAAESAAETSAGMSHVAHWDDGP